MREYFYFNPYLAFVGRVIGRRTIEPNTKKSKIFLCYIITN